MARTKATGRRDTGYVPRGALPASDSHPVIAAIIQGLIELWRNRYRKIVAHLDAFSSTDSPHRTDREAPSATATTTIVVRPSRHPGQSIPPEIILEIGKHLEHPQDLYSFSMTCTQLNRILTSKSTRFLWVAALDAFVFPNPSEEPRPERPEFMNELQYVSFLFGEHCMACDGARDCTTFWTLHVRLCCLCQPLNMATVPELIEFIRSKKHPRVAKPKMLEIIHAIASSDPLYRSPLSLLRTGEADTLRMRDEAHLIISTLLTVLKEERTPAKRNTAEGIDHLVAAVSSLSSERIWTGAGFQRALTPY